MPFPITIESPPTLVAGLVLTFGLAAWLIHRGAAALASTLRVLAMLGLSLAAAGAVWLRPHPLRIAVMVDLSPSTRGAGYRQSDLLRRRLQELLGRQPFDLFAFAQNRVPLSLDGNQPLADLPAAQTRFDPPDADAIVLLSDGNFALPAAPTAPVYPVIDPLLNDVNDDAVTNIEQRGNRVAIDVSHRGPPRTLHLTGTVGPTDVPIDASLTVVQSIAPGATQVVASLSGGDAWPENDAMSLALPAPMHRQKWWIGTSAPDASWRMVSPSAVADLPPGEWLAPSVVVLDNIAAAASPDAMPTPAQRNLAAYIRDLGGTLVILGGDHAFAAGGYTGTPLDALSPLASAPSSPRIRWIVLVDASGSMGAAAGVDRATEWDLATTAAVHLLQELPPDDPIQIGQFSDQIRWWANGVAVYQAASLALPPAWAVPHGPTNLQAALSAIAADEATGSQPMPTQLLLMTDADAAIDQPANLANALGANQIHLDLLALGNGSALGALQQIVRDTGGSTLTEVNPAHWGAALQQLLHSAAGSSLRSEPMTVDFLDAASSLGATPILRWNQTWPRSGVTPLAQQGGANNRTMAAMWQFGAGRVVATSFATDPSLAARLADLFAQPPTDPRIRVWREARSLDVEAIDGKRYINALPLTVELSDAWGLALSDRIAVPQTGPGTYAVELPTVNGAVLATVFNGGVAVDRVALPTRPAPEFERIGNNLGALRTFASNSGGRVILPTDHQPLDLAGQPEARSMGSLLAIIAAVGVLGSLLADRRRRR